MLFLYYVAKILSVVFVIIFYLSICFFVSCLVFVYMPTNDSQYKVVIASLTHGRWLNKNTDSLNQ